MGMDQAIKDFAKQFSYEPKIENKNNYQRKSKFLVTGMGGSHLAADLLSAWDRALPVIVHSDYGLPQIEENELKDITVIASSYSGNTEEVLDGYKTAKEKRLNLICIAVGGKLIELAKADQIPCIEMPDTGIQPRSALGYSMKALMLAMGLEAGLKEAGDLADTLMPNQLEKDGKELAEKFKGYVPIIYSSAINKPIVYNWKIKLNETGKIPAFYNVFPELNHNEMNGFDVKESSQALSENFKWIFIKDSDDHPRISKRMTVLEKQLSDRGFTVEIMSLEGNSKLEKIFRSLIVADWFAFHTAEMYGLESEQVPMIEEFKKYIAE